MAQSKFTVYKYIKLADGSWRYCRAAFYSNGKIKPNRCIVGGKEEEHPEGAYYPYHRKQWIAVGANALDAQHQRKVRLDEEEFKRLRGTAPMQKATVETTFGKSPLAVATDRYFTNLEARGLNSKSIRTYRSGVDPFVENCPKTYVEDAVCAATNIALSLIDDSRKSPLGLATIASSGARASAQIIARRCELRLHWTTTGMLCNRVHLRIASESATTC